MSKKKGLLVRIPNSKQYKDVLRRKKYFIEKIISFMGESLAGKGEEAALLHRKSRWMGAK
jgi:hypothetical protein